MWIAASSNLFIKSLSHVDINQDKSSITIIICDEDFMYIFLHVIDSVLLYLYFKATCEHL